MAKKPKFDQEAAFKAIVGIGHEEPVEGQLNLDETSGNADLPQAEATSQAAEPESVPKRAGRPKMQRETKKRITFTILPSLYEQASEIAYNEGKNMSELISNFLTEYVKTHG